MLQRAHRQAVPMVFAEAGIPPLDILRFATQASAETVGAQDHLGTLEVATRMEHLWLDGET